jgi:hypothetical protein
VGDLILGLKNTYKLWDEVGCRVAVGKSTGEGKRGRRGLRSKTTPFCGFYFLILTRAF